MNLSALAPTSALSTHAATAVAADSFPSGEVRVGTLAARFKRDDGLYMGRDGQRFDQVEDAIRGAATLAQSTGATAGVREHAQGGYYVGELLQPVWYKRLGRETATGLRAAQITPLPSGFGDDQKFSFSSYRSPSDSRYDDERTGTIKLGDGLIAVAGSYWGYTGGRVFDVEPIAPPAPNPEPVPAPAPEPAPAPAPPARSYVEDLTEAARLATESARIISTIPPSDRGDASTKDVRLRAYRTSQAAQRRIEVQIDNARNDAGILSQLRSADASLEDSGWQLQNKHSPDGRFTGVDIPGALRDTQRAVDLLGELLKDATGNAGGGSGTAPANPPVFSPPATSDSDAAGDEVVAGAPIVAA